MRDAQHENLAQLNAWHAFSQEKSIGVIDGFNIEAVTNYDLEPFGP